MECLYSLEVEPGAVGGAHHADLDRAAGHTAQYGAGCLQARSPPIGATAPHVAQVVTAVVTSETNTSPRIPAAAFPSRVISSISASSCRSESFGPDVGRLVADGDEVVGDRFHEGGRVADIAAEGAVWVALPGRTLDRCGPRGLRRGPQAVGLPHHSRRVVGSYQRGHRLTLDPATLLRTSAGAVSPEEVLVCRPTPRPWQPRCVGSERSALGLALPGAFDVSETRPQPQCARRTVRASIGEQRVTPRATFQIADIEGGAG